MSDGKQPTPWQRLSDDEREQLLEDLREGVSDDPTMARCRVASEAMKIAAECLAFVHSETRAVEVRRDDDGYPYFQEANGERAYSAEEVADMFNAAQRLQSAGRRKLSELVPTNWVDPILSGPSAVFDPLGRIEPKHVEALLRAIKKRIEEAETA